MPDKDQSRALSNELDMDAYHSEGIDPGEHKVFNINPTIHSFNERFQGESPVSAGPGLEGYDPDKMPDWWVKSLKAMRADWPNDPGPRVLSNRGVDRSYEEPLALPLGERGLQPISEKQKGPFDIPLEGGGGARFGETTTTEPLFKSSRGRPSAEVSESLSNVEKGIKEGLDAGKSTYEIANEMGMSQSGLRRYMDKRGWKSQYSQVGGLEAKTNWPPERDKMLKELNEQGLSFSEIANKMGVTRGAVAGRLTRIKDKPDTTRLWRGETDFPNEPKRELSDWVKENPEFQSMVEASGRWFNATREEAEYYNRTFGDKTGRVSYVDVPTADLEKYRVSNLPKEIQRFSVQGMREREFFLPKDISERRISFEK